MSRTFSLVSLATLALAGCSLAPTTPSAVHEAPARRLPEPTPDERVDPVEARATKAQQRDQVATYIAYRLLGRYAYGYRPESRSESHAREAMRRLGITARSAKNILTSERAMQFFDEGDPRLMRLSLDTPADSVALAIARYAPEAFAAEEEPPSDEEATETAAEQAGLRCLDVGLCDEQPGIIPDKDLKWGLVPTQPLLHHAVGDLGMHGFPGDVPDNPGMPMYVPLARYDFGGQVDAPLTACLSDADCGGLDHLTTSCVPLDGDGDGYPLWGEVAHEYAPCLAWGWDLDALDQAECAFHGGRAGDLTAQGGIPEATQAALPTPYANPPQELEAFAEMCTAAPWDPACWPSACAREPAWGDPASLVMNGVDTDRLYVGAKVMVDTASSAALLRVADLDGKPVPEVRGLMAGPEGELYVGFDNGNAMPAADWGATDQGDFHLVQDTVTMGATSAADSELLAFLATPPNEALRYLTLDEQEDIIDLWVVDLPPGITPGIYELRGTWHVNAWLDAMPESWKKFSQDHVHAECVSWREAANAPALEALCDPYSYDQSPGFIPGDPIRLTNPLYVRVLAPERQEKIELEVPDFRVIHAQEGNDDPGFATMAMVVDPSDEAAMATCQQALLAVIDGVPSPSLDEDIITPCELRTAGASFDSVEEGSIGALDFRARFTIADGQQLITGTHIWEFDDSAAAEEALDLIAVISFAAADLMPEGYEAYAAIIAAVATVFDLSAGITADLDHPEYLGRAFGGYPFEDLVYLTRAAQQSRLVTTMRADHETSTAWVEPLDIHSFKTTYEELAAQVNSDNDGVITVTEQPYLDGEQIVANPRAVHGEPAWGEAHVFRRVLADNPTASYGADCSLYELHHRVRQVREQ